MANKKKPSGSGQRSGSSDQLNRVRGASPRRPESTGQSYHRGSGTKPSPSPAPAPAKEKPSGENTLRTILISLGVDVKSIEARRKIKQQKKEKSADGESWFEKLLGKISASSETEAENEEEKISDIGSYRKKIDKESKAYKVGRVVFYALTAGLAVFFFSGIFSIGRVNTEMVMTATVEDTIDVKSGISIRDEKIISTDQNGIIVSAIDSGGKVSKGETVARVFNSVDAAQAYDRIAEIDRLLERFDDMSTAAEERSSNISSTQKQLNDRFLELSRYIYSGELKRADKMGDDILYLLNKQQIATSVVEDFSGRTEELKAERSRLAKMYKESPAQLLSPRSGYYISKVDGYENTLSTDKLENLTAEQLDELLMQRNNDQSNWVVGKIADDYIWYIACEVTAKQAELVNISQMYTLRLPYSDTDSIKAKLKYINKYEGSKRALLIFECTYMVSELSEIRSQPMTIVLSSYTGLELDRSSLVELTNEDRERFGLEALPEPSMIPDEEAAAPEEPQEKIMGVYILWGNEVRMRLVSIMYEQGDKVICSQKTGEGWLKLYDKVVTRTKGLHDGKIINGAGSS